MSEVITKEHEHVVADATHETPGAYDETPTPKKAKKPRAPKARSIEEIIKSPANKRTEKEKDLYISYLEDENQVLAAKNRELNINVQSFTEQLRRKENQFTQMEGHYRAVLQDVYDATKVHHKNISALLYGGVNHD